MKYKVFTEDIKQENEVYFRLREFGDGIMLMACERDGTTLIRGIILKITPGKEVKLISNVDEGIGLPLDEALRVKIT